MERFWPLDLPVDVALKNRRKEVLDHSKSLGLFRPKLSAGLKMIVLARGWPPGAIREVVRTNCQLIL